MIAKQISVFLENKAGELAKFTEVLDKNKIDMHALSVADTPDFGIVRLIVDDSDLTAEKLKEAGYILSITPVLAVELPDVPGGLNQILQVLDKAGINVDYTYAFTGRKSKIAYMIFRVADNDAAIRVLEAANVKIIGQNELLDL